MENLSERRRPSVSTSGFSGLRRSRSVRASLRKLGDRWKQPKQPTKTSLNSPTITDERCLLLDLTNTKNSLDVSLQNGDNWAHDDKNWSRNKDNKEGRNWGHQDSEKLVHNGEKWSQNCQNHDPSGANNVLQNGTRQNLEKWVQNTSKSSKNVEHWTQNTIFEPKDVENWVQNSNFAIKSSDNRVLRYDQRRHRRQQSFDGFSQNLQLSNQNISIDSSRTGNFIGTRDLEGSQTPLGYFSSSESNFGNFQLPSDFLEENFGQPGILRIPRAVTMENGGRFKSSEGQRNPTATVRTTSMWTSKLQNLESTHRGGSLSVFSGPVLGANVGQTVGQHSVAAYGGKISKKLSKQAQAHLDKLTQINIHLHALFAAVEHGHLEKARTILESTDVDVNSLNSDGLSALDVAVLTNNRGLARTLMNFGARESRQFKTPEALGIRLRQLLQEAEIRTQEFGGIIDDDCSNSYGNNRASFSIIGTQTSTIDPDSSDARRLAQWERRLRALRRLQLGWDQARPPDPPLGVDLDLTGSTEVAIRVKTDQVDPAGCIATRWKVQWSTRADFTNLCGEREMALAGTQCLSRITDLTLGRRYFFRVAAGNLKGWGEYRCSSPASVVPSCWRDLDTRQSRWTGRLQSLNSLFSAVKRARPEDASDIVETSNKDQRDPKRNSKTKTKTTIKQLFTAASKFTKSLRRGIYLACILYHDDKVLVTNEEFVPVIEVDETYPSCINNDYHWLMKVGCTWDDVKCLRGDMERSNAVMSQPAVIFRSKLLAAAQQMQNALGVQDLGQLYHKPLRDAQGTLVICCINYIKTPKSISVLNSRWLPLNKIHKKMMLHDELNYINDILMGSIQEQIIYHQASSVKLSRGLYLGYLKMQSSVDSIQVVVPARTPNVLPYYKIRDNPHVSAEEWEYLKSHQSLSESQQDKIEGDEMQQNFVDQIVAAADRLFRNMDIARSDALAHRIYDTEVVELNTDVSLLILCPQAEQACAVPGQRETLLQRSDLLSLPVQAFEMIHLHTYRPDIVRRYSRLSCILELDTVLANHTHREAFSASEVQTARERLSRLQNLQQELNTVWKGARWLMDAISFARDRGATVNPGIHMSWILSPNSCDFDTANQDEGIEPSGLLINSTNNLNSSSNGLKRSLLQIPPRDSKQVKSSPGRGSWPGPTASTGVQGGTSAVSSASLLHTEFSKSEQHLTLASSSNLLLVSGVNSNGTNGSSRKNSGDSDCTESSVGGCYYNPGLAGLREIPSSLHSSRLPPSRSEDTLLMRHQDSSGRMQDRLRGDQDLKSNRHSANPRLRCSTLGATSAGSSPLLLMTGSAGSIRATDTNSDSMHSLSSDSETCSCPASGSGLTSNTTNVNKFKNPGGSHSLSNVSHETEFRGQKSQHRSPESKFLDVHKNEKNHLKKNSLSEFVTPRDPDGFKRPLAVPMIRPDQQTVQYLRPTLEAEMQSASKENVKLTVMRADKFNTSTPIKGKEQLGSPKQESPKSQPNSPDRVASGSVTRNDEQQSTSGTRSKQENVVATAPGIIQVYAAYETGLASGTSLKLHITPRTTAREVVDLVVKQLNMAVVLKGRDGPIYTSDKLKNFCLVAVIGARERCLRDDFKPLQLQNPWRKGRLYVRQKHDLLAAIEHSSKHSAFL